MFSYEGEKRKNSNHLAFTEDEVKLAHSMMSELKTTMEFFRYLMNHRGELSLTMVLISSDDIKLDHLLPKWKRKTDVLFELDKINNVYVCVCQSTDKEGGRQFAEILMSNIRLHGDSDTYCVVSELKTIKKESIQEVIFEMVEKYIIIKEEKKANQVFFTDSENDEERKNTDIS